jgi:hypothetical protein
MIFISASHPCKVLLATQTVCFEICEITEFRRQEEDRIKKDSMVSPERAS